MRYTLRDLMAAARAVDAVDRLKADLAEFAARHLPECNPEADGIIDFLDVSTGDAFDVPAEKAIEYFMAKGLRPTFSYAEMLGQAHDAAFTVAKMMDVDMLSTVRESLSAALASGTSFGEWRKQLAPILQSAGWWGDADMVDPATGQTVRAKLGSAWRLETIFRTNMQAAYAAGHWSMIKTQADVAPFLMYDAVDDYRTRPLHASWDSTVLPVTSPWWKTHFPPNGYNCRCGVIQLSWQQLRDMGLTPRADPPSDGFYQWQNPRTGEVLKVPAGIDPGFDRMPGGGFDEHLRTLLDEKIKTLPPTMQKAISQVVRRQFDASTAAGKWHAVSFEDAPDWLRDAVLDREAVTVQAKSKQGAYAQGGQLVDMDGEKIDAKRGQSVWRHEFGHILDVRLGKRTMYRSSDFDFMAAQKRDAERLTAAAGNGRKSKANDALRADVVKAYEDARELMIDTDRAARVDTLRELATKAGVDFDAFLQVVRDSTLILDDGVELEGVGTAVRLARMIEAIRMGDGEGFVRLASFKDHVEEMLKTRQYDKGVVSTMSQSWRKDGSLSSLSDLIGSATRNRASGYSDGFPGHSDAYYRKSPVNAPTESFANLTALAGHPNPYWWQIARRFAPEMADLYRLIIEGEA